MIPIPRSGLQWLRRNRSRSSSIACCLRVRVLRDSAGLPLRPHAHAPPAVAVGLRLHGGAIARIDRAMLAGVFGLGVCRAAATVGDGVAIDVLQEGPAAVRRSALHDAQGASLADGGPGGPVDCTRQSAGSTQLRARGLCRRAGDRRQHAPPGAATCGLKKSCLKQRHKGPIGWRWGSPIKKSVKSAG